MVLDHTIGLPAVGTPAPAGALTAPGWMVRALERQAPFWRPGTRTGYHALTLILTKPGRFFYPKRQKNTKNQMVTEPWAGTNQRSFQVILSCSVGLALCQAGCRLY